MTRPVALFIPLERRRFIQLCAGSLAAAAVGSCRSKDRAYSRRSTVIVGVPDVEELHPDPYQSAQWLVFLPLAAWNEKGEWEGRLAERWEHSPDYREWTYYLRPGVQWHDGVPVTAHDVKYSLELLTHPDVLEINPGSIESITVLNAQTVMVRHRHITNYAVDNVTYPKHLLERLDPKQFYDWEFWKHPVGNGPYRFVRYQPQTMIEFEANPDYYRGQPKIERVVLKFVGEAGLADLLAGNLDALVWVNPAWIASLAADARFHVYYSDSPYYAAIVWQHRYPLFREPRVRRALTLAINRRELLQLMHVPRESPLTDGPLTRSQLRRHELAEPLPYDPAQGRDLLEAAGWHNGNGGGVREREGIPFRFTMLASSNPHVQQLALYVQAELRRVGVDMAVQTQEGIDGIIRRGELQEAAIKTIPRSLLFDRIGADALGYRNARVAELVNRALVTADPDVEDRIYSELREIFREDVPVTYLVPAANTPVAHGRIRGLSSPFRTNVLQFMDELSLDEER